VEVDVDVVLELLPSDDGLCVESISSRPEIPLKPNVVRALTACLRGLNSNRGRSLVINI